MEHAHFRNYCNNIEKLLRPEIKQSDWFKEGKAAVILDEMYLPAGMDTEYLMHVALMITDEYFNPTPKKTLF